jgi:hypothetical protein
MVIPSSYVKSKYSPASVQKGVSGSGLVAVATMSSSTRSVGGSEGCLPAFLLLVEEEIVVVVEIKDFLSFDFVWKM